MGGAGVETYKITVYTGDEQYAGTDASVYIVLKGNKGSSGEQPLTSKNPRPLFERDQLDVFEFQCNDVGNLQEVM